jgi:hypothetical protein
LLLFGCAGEQRSPLGLKATTAECDNDRALERDSERMQCYHMVALTQAHLGSPAAEGTCREIWTTFGVNAPDPKGDDVVKAEMVSNNCYYDVALILRSRGVCREIGPKRTSATHNAVTTGLLGESVSQERCEREVDRLARLAPERYHSPGADNLCSLLFVLPVLLVGAFRCP